jgi:hypothetical protein
MSDGKGKRRAKGDEDTENPAASDNVFQNSSSMLGRLTASAAGLAQSALTAPSSTEISDRASATLTSAGKGPQTGGNHSSAWAESSRASQQPTLPTLHGQPPSSFRSGHSEEHARGAEAEFSSFLDGIDPFMPFSEVRGGASLTPRPENVTPLDGIRIGTETVRDQYGQATYNSVDEQQSHDGEEVWAILSKPSAMSDDLELLQDEDERVNWNLTDQQISRLRMIMDELLPPPESHIPQQIDHPMNLVPHMLSTSVIYPSNPITAREEDSILYFGSSMPQETARQTWMSQWESVLTRYTDEVWGNLLPLVTEARQEINALKGEPATALAEPPTALRRLQLVLDHLRKL